MLSMRFCLLGIATGCMLSVKLSEGEDIIKMGVFCGETLASTKK
ncbi:hypothetical protein ADICEAN_01520 [Cesiribacter andamanensis AMV16]|uniref:Uncharacterized protein n=1 Tax=Cesiribacter andamanensis AMV16 TaxID=1279009 RepID=M7N3V3_9BACT|nr:hypothetical protein ADICEAN_01520 [Cesiribacter andamanensis AMV16]